MTKADVCRQYRDKFPDMPTLKLARIILKKEQPMFDNIENTRTILRGIEGKKGVSKRATIKATHKADTRPYNPYKLPDSDETKFEPYVLRGKRIGVMCDIHVPYHSISALTAAITWLKSCNIDTLLINGDFFDFHGISRFVKDPRKKNFAEEIRVGCELFKSLQDALGVPIVFKWGNHEARYEHFLWMKAGELSGVEDFELKNLITKRVGGVEFITDKRILKAGGLNIVHGHELPTSVMSPVNIARGLYLRAKASTICGHHHRTSEHTEQDINGKIVTTWSVGCLSELHPDYMPINSWNTGVCFVEVDGEDYNVVNKRIYKGKIL